MIPLARYSPHLNPKEHEWRILKRDHRGHLAPTLRDFVDAVATALAGLGGERCEVIDAVPQWWLGRASQGADRPASGRLLAMPLQPPWGTASMTSHRSPPTAKPAATASTKSRNVGARWPRWSRLRIRHSCSLGLRWGL